MSKKEVNLVKKIKGMLEKIGCPRFLHHFGPKKYEFKIQVIVLLLKKVLRCSFRRVVKVSSMLGLAVPTYSAPYKMRERMPLWIWNKLLTLTAGETSGTIAIDGTGFSRTNPSFHYLKRIDHKNPRGYAKLSALFDIPNKKFTTLKVRTKPRHDVIDAKPLMKKTKKIKKLLGDTAYDSEELHEHCYCRKIQTIIKPRKNVKRGWARKKQMKNYSERKYHPRSLIESGFGSLKRKYGGSVLAKKSKGVKTEIYCKAIAHNIGLLN